MSLRWVESHAPILDTTLLVEALEELGVEYQDLGNLIAVKAAMNRYREAPQFVQRQGAWVLRHGAITSHTRWAKKFADTLSAVERRRQEQIEEELRRQQEARERDARRQLVERRRAAIVENAEKLGYEVTEKREGEQVRLVLVRRTY
jgi:hypothetical protein